MKLSTMKYEFFSGRLPNGKKWSFEKKFQTRFEEAKKPQI